MVLVVVVAVVVIYLCIYLSIYLCIYLSASILTSKCALRHNAVHFFDIWTSKSALNVRVFLAFSLANVLRATRVQFFISHLASWLRTRRFSEPTFRPSGATNHGKTQCFATFVPFRAPGSSFFRDFLFCDLLSSSLLFSCLTLPISAFHLSILSEVWLLNFLRLLD